MLKQFKLLHLNRKLHFSGVSQLGYTSPKPPEETDSNIFTAAASSP